MDIETANLEIKQKKLKIRQNKMENRIKSFKEFYPYYLTEHRKKGTKIFHFVGTFLVFCIIGMSIYYGKPIILLYALLAGYGFAWISHAFIEKNKPATFKYPLWSLLSDFKLFFDLILGKQKF